MHRQWFDPDPHEVRRVRRFVRDALSLHPSQVDDAELLASELATNVVRHARTPFEVAVDERGDAVRIVVRDDDPALPAARDAGPGDDTGRGLTLVERVARRWGVTRIPGDGKAVWFDLGGET